MPPPDPDQRPKLLICINMRPGRPGECCSSRGSPKLADMIEAEIRARRLDTEVERIRCLGECKRGPAMRIAPGGRFFLGVREETLEEVYAALEATCGRLPEPEPGTGPGESEPSAPDAVAAMYFPGT